MERSKLEPAEISNLWQSYVTDTMAIWVSRHFITTVKDKDINDMLQLAEKFAMEEAEQSKSLLVEANEPLPQPFDEKDVVVNGEPLFTDNYVLLLKYSLAQAAMTVFALSLNTSTRSDIRRFYQKCIQNASELLNHCMDIMVNKKLVLPEIHIPTPNTIEKVNSNEYLGGWFANKRPINAQEIGQIVYNFRSTEIHKEFIRGAARVTKSSELKKHYQQGVEIFQKHLNEFQSILSQNGLPNLPTWDSEILETDTSPFSDRLINYKHTALTSQAAARYGAALCSVMRKDIGAHFMRLMSETLVYEEDAANLMIKNNFLINCLWRKRNKNNYKIKAANILIEGCWLF